MPLVDPVTTATRPSSGRAMSAMLLDLHVHMRALLWLIATKDAEHAAPTEMRSLCIDSMPPRDFHARVRPA